MNEEIDLITSRIEALEAAVCGTPGALARRDQKLGELKARLAELGPPRRTIRFDKLGVLRNDTPGLGGGAALPLRRAESWAGVMPSAEDPAPAALPWIRESDRSGEAARLAHLAGEVDLAEGG